jgi:CHAT domain-containing protein
MTKFYEQIDAHDANIALALNTAQIWLRDTTAQDFRDWLPKSRLRADWQQQIAEMFEEFEDTDRPLKSPENWAAFCVTGQGG